MNECLHAEVYIWIRAHLLSHSLVEIIRKDAVSWSTDN